MTPSSAATTSTTTSVTRAPRARIMVNASWPGVSRNTTLRSLTRTEYAPMCWVMPPASRSATRADRSARHQVGRVDVLGFDLQHFLFERLHLDVGAELPRDHRRRLVVERAVDR